MKIKVLQKLKPKTTAFGFNQVELDGVAATIAGNLTEESTDEQIDAAIDAVLPFLKVSQQVASRVINQKKTEQEPNDPNNPKPTDDEPAWFKAYREKAEAEIMELKNQNIVKSRRSVFEAMLEGLPAKQKESKLKDFDRIRFADDNDFNGYVEEQKEVVKAIKLELTESGLDVMITPGNGHSANEEEEFIKNMQDINKKV